VKETNKEKNSDSGGCKNQPFYNSPGKVRMDDNMT
jgi:hypothetical protein